MPRSNQKSSILWTILWHPVIWFVVATIMLIFSASALWRQHRPDLLDDSQFLVQADNIELSEPPEWLEPRVTEAVHRISNAKPSLLDPNIVVQTYDYLDRINWIGKVNRVEKFHSGMQISVDYRQPVAFVNLDRNTAIPVDQDGVIIDRDILNNTQYQIMRRRLMSISMRRLNTRGASVPWQKWPDQRIPLAIDLCRFLAPVSQQLELAQVVSFDLPNQSTPPQLEIWTPNRTVVYWGSAPGHELAGEASSEQKLAALQDFIDRNGKLSKFDQRKSVQIDVSSGSVVLVKSNRLAELEDINAPSIK